MKVTPVNGMGNYGVYIDGVDFDNIHDEQWMEIGDILMKQLVVIIRDTNMQPKKIKGMLEKWGKLRSSGLYNVCKSYDIPAIDVINKALKHSPEIKEEHAEVIRQWFKTRGPLGTQRVTNIRDKKGGYTGIFPDGELKWHSNEAGNHIFAPGVALLGQENMIGSSTGFLQTADYWEDISESFRSELKEMEVIHRHKPGMLHVKDLGVQEALTNMNMNPEPENHIPMVIKSPGGITGLHYSLNTSDGIVGMSKAESDKLFERLNKELMTDRYMWDHWYQSNTDWLFFDNSIVNHRRLGDEPGRLAFRVQHDYAHIQIPNYNPYFEPEHAAKYDSKLAEFEHFMETNFGDH